VTGLGVLLFLLVHIVDITLIGFGPQVYNESLQVFGTPIVRLISLALIASVLYHAFNGVRVIIIDFWSAGYKYQRQMFYAVLALSIISFVPMAFFVIAPVFGVCPQGDCNAIPM
jgi:succinate dehydrogenase cytochrome b subunit